MLEAAVVAYGTPLRLRAGDGRLLQGLLGRLPPSWESAGNGGGGRCYVLTRSAGSLTLTADGETLAEGDDEYALSAFQADLDSHVAECSADRVFVHAGVVEWRGRAIVLPGPSLAGKTTLTTALLEAGATYFSDEFAVLDAEGRVHPYPRPLGLRDPATGTRTSRSAASLDSAVGTEPQPVALVAVVRYDGSVRSWRPRPLSPAQGALALLANTVSARRDPGRALRVLERVAAGAVFVEALRGEAPTVAPGLLVLAEESRAA
jgi:hypothetical protein